MQWPNVSAVLRDIPHAIAGGVATRAYMPERATAALDVVVLPRDASRVAALLSGAGYKRVGALTVGGSAWRAPGSTPVDILEGPESWWNGAALAEAGEQRDADGSPVLPLHWLVLMKLSASRAQDVADVARMLGHASDAALAVVRTTVRSHAAGLSDDLESLIALGRLETGRDG